MSEELSSKDKKVQPKAMEDPDDGNTGDKNTRGSFHDLEVYHAQHSPEHLGKDLASSHPSDDEDEVTKEAAERHPSPPSPDQSW